MPDLTCTCGAEATIPVYAPDMCADCDAAAWARIAATAALEAPAPGNTISNVWD